MHRLVVRMPRRQLTAASIAGEIAFARPTTPISDTSKSPKLAHAAPALGGGACTDSSSACPGGRK